MPIAAVATSPAPPLTAGLTLADAFKRMRTHDLNLALAQTSVEQATADVFSAGERPNATLSYGTSKINPAGHNGPGTLWDKSFDTFVSISQPFERSGKREHRMAEAKGRSQTPGATPTTGVA